MENVSESLNIKEINVSVSIPMERMRLMDGPICGWEFTKLEDIFAQKRDLARSSKIKFQLDMARALVKWGSVCSDSIKEISQSAESMTFKFVFHSAESAIEFLSNLTENVEGAMIRH